MRKLQWIFDNKLMIVTVPLLAAGIGWSVRIWTDNISKTAYERGVAYEKAICLEEYKRELKIRNEQIEDALKKSNEGYRQLIALRWHCKQCCTSGCDEE